MLKVASGTVSPEFRVRSLIWRIRCDDREWIYQIKFPPYEAADWRSLTRRVYRLRLMPSGEIRVVWPSAGKFTQAPREQHEELIILPLQTNLIINASSARLSPPADKQ